MATNSALPTVLEGIVEGRREHLAGIRQRIAHVDLDSLPRSTRSLYDSLGGNLPGHGRGSRGGSAAVHHGMQVGVALAGDDPGTVPPR